MGGKPISTIKNPYSLDYYRDLFTVLSRPKGAES